MKMIRNLPSMLVQFYVLLKKIGLLVFLKLTTLDFCSICVKCLQEYKMDNNAFSYVH